jgi:hypothetical protein
METFCLVQCS